MTKKKPQEDSAKRTEVPDYVKQGIRSPNSPNWNMPVDLNHLTRKTT